MWCGTATGEMIPPWLCIKLKQPTKDSAAGDLLAPFMMLQKVGGSKAEPFCDGSTNVFWLLPKSFPEQKFLQATISCPILRQR